MYKNVTSGPSYITDIFISHKYNEVAACSLLLILFNVTVRRGCRWIVTKSFNLCLYQAHSREITHLLACVRLSIHKSTTLLKWSNLTMKRAHLPMEFRTHFDLTKHSFQPPLFFRHSGNLDELNRELSPIFVNDHMIWFRKFPQLPSMMVNFGRKCDITLPMVVNYCQKMGLLVKNRPI